MKVSSNEFMSIFATVDYASWNPGEILKGKIKLNVKKACRLRGLFLNIIGVERVTVYDSKSPTGVSKYDSSTSLTKRSLQTNYL